MAYKVFVNGYPLNASELNQYLMSQSIAVFVDATARDAAIETPVEGQFCYLTGSNELQKFDGSDWVAYAPSNAVSEKSADYTITAADANSYIYVTAEASITIADVLQVGETVNIISTTADAVDLVADTGVTIYSKGDALTLTGQYSGVSVTKKATNTYFAIGDLS